MALRPARGEIGAWRQADESAATSERPPSLTAHPRWLVVVACLAWVLAIGELRLDLLSSVLLTPALVVAPVVAAFVLSRSLTALVAGAAVVMAYVLSIADDGALTLQHSINVALVVLVGALSFALAGLRSQLERSLGEAEGLAARDDLTGVLNRRGVMALASKLMDIRTADRPRLHLVMLDADRFKTINDSKGHDAGDEVLREMTRRVSDALRKGDLFGRIGGEEFLVVLVGATEEDASRAIDRMLDSVSSDPVMTSGGPVTVSLSAGASTVGYEDASLWEALRRADNALFSSKRSGGNCLTWS